MKFKFSLESVLQVRKHEEKVQKQKLAKEVAKKNEFTAKKQKLREKLTNYLESANRDEFENVHNIRRNNDYLQEVHHQIKKLDEKLQLVEESVDEEREKLAAIHKKRHIMEKVKEEEQEAFYEKLSKQQQKIMDEVATQTYKF